METINAPAGTIGARLSAVAARIPDRTAIVEHDSRTSFRQLDTAATTIAWRLSQTCGGEFGRVGLFFERKGRAIEAIFGAGRAGQPYVLIDANDPAERLRLILEDSAPVALLTESALLGRAQEIAPEGCPVFDAAALEPAPDRCSLPEVSTDALVYLCYTSGCTGRPKGVTQTHGNLLFFADAYARALRIGDTDRASLLYTLSFNASNMDIFGSLLCGATLCACDPRREGLARLADWLDRERVTVLHTVPTLFRELAGRLAPGRVLPHLRLIDLGGEAMFASDVALFQAHTLEHCVLVNQLASTEVGIIAQHVVGHRQPAAPGSIVAVGRPPDGVQLWIRRDDGKLAGVNEVGEVMIRSAHVSPGYWRQASLDATAFSGDPHEPSSRQFASGDLGRIDEAGKLFFLGRKGSRVKVRGHTVDLMEVEAAIASCPGVGKTAVLASEPEAGADSARLVAYVAVQDVDERNPALLRRQLGARIPEYMLPAAFVFLDALPATPSGKIDRRALAAMGSVAAEGQREVALPRDDIEREVATIFAQLLQLAPIDRQDDFFLLGGDSLLSVELQAQLGSAFGVRLDNLHEHATVAGIAAEITRRALARVNAAIAAPVLIPLWRQGSAPPLFLVHGRHGQAFVSPHFMRLLGDDQPVWVFQARGLDATEEPHRTVEAMADEYLNEMQRQQPEGPYFLGALCAGAYVALAMARTLRDAGKRVLPLLLLDPPDGVQGEGYAQMQEEQFIAKMRARRALGRTAGPVEDPAYMQAVIRVAKAFEAAIACHQPQPYDGPVYMLASRQRIERTDPAAWRKILTGRLKRYEVGTTHAQALDPRNPVFASYLLRCVGLIREAAAEASFASV